ncbi:MAG: hypothetical protein HUJ76_13345, partial [Parasporobacterium sp.]|nr:hypothetical protein [Parasporobacterium sp.]
MKKVVAILLAGCLTVLSVMSCSAAEKTDVLKIGALLHSSGFFAALDLNNLYEL